MSKTTDYRCLAIALHDSYESLHDAALLAFMTEKDYWLETCAFEVMEIEDALRRFREGKPQKFKE